MRKFALAITSVLCLIAATSTLLAATPAAQQDLWKAKVSQSLPLLGHRNWILIVDSAYPLQSSQGIETIETGAGQLDVVRYVLNAVRQSIHVRPLIYMDAELPFVPEQDAPGASAYREQIGQVLSGLPITALPHEKLLSDIDEASRQFHVLIFKTRMTIPYTSVFIRLDCRYWSADAEARLRAKMAAAAQSGAHQTP